MMGREARNGEGGSRTPSATKTYQQTMEHLQTPPTDTQWNTMREIEGIGLSLAGKDREPTDIVGALVPHIRKAYPEARVSYSHTNRGTALRVYVEPKEGKPFTLPISRAVVYACKFYPGNA